MIEAIARWGNVWLPFITPNNASFWMVAGIAMVVSGSLLLGLVIYLRRQRRYRL